MASTEQQEHAAPLLQPEVEEAYTSDGSLDIDGNPALKHRTGGWRACRSILGAEFCYCLANNGIMYNLVTYLTTQLHQSNVAAAKNVSIWKATCFLTPLAGAVVADSYWGRYRTMVVACCVGVAVSLLRSPHFNQSLHPAMNSAQGMLMASLSALLPQLIESSSTLSMPSAQEFVLFLGLYMIAFGFDAGDTSERASKASLFNWYVFTMNCAAVISATGLVWVQGHYGWALGLGIPAMVLAVGLSCLVAASRTYRFQTTRGSPLTRVCQVAVAAVRKFNVAAPGDMALLYELPDDASSMKGVERIEHTTDLEFFDKAAVVTASDEEAPRNPWRLCMVTQVEELKILVRMLPVWACIAFFYTGTAQTKSTFVEQGMPMDAHVGALRVPPASLAAFQMLTTIVLIPLYDRVFVPAARKHTGREKGISDLLRIGGGLATVGLAMAAAATVETKRASAARTTASILWQAPQFVLVGAGELLATIGQLDFFYSQAPPAMKTVCTALGLLAVAAGDYLSSVIVTAVSWATASGGRPGWIPDDLNEGHLDSFFWMTAGLGCLDLLAFTCCAKRYSKSRKAFHELSIDRIFAMASSEQQEHAVALLQPKVEEAYTTDGSLDIDGNPALKHRTGGWRACRSILGTEFCYCLAYYGIMYNLVTYLTTVLHQSNVAAAKNVSTWQATCFLTPLAGAVVADSYWGRYRTMVVGCCVAVAGMLMASLSALLPQLIESSSTLSMEIILFLGLYMIAFGVGGLRPCLISFGADQFDAGDPSELISKGSYFNWYIFTMNCGSVISTSGMVWVQDHYGWALGLAIPAMVLAVGLSCLVAASRAYRFQTTRGSPLTRVCQVVVAAVCKFNVAPPDDMSLLYELPDDASSMKVVERIEHTTDLRFFDKAAVVTASDEEAAGAAPRNPWRLCVVTQVEELKIFVRMLPLWACITFFYTGTAQVNSTFVEQGMAMDARVGSLRVPPARLTGRERGISELVRIGGGLAMVVLAMAAAALVETKRVRAWQTAMEKTSIMWQVPQFVLVGVGELLTSIGQLDFFYSQAPPAMKTVCAALALGAIAAGDYLSSIIVTAVSWATATGGRPGWIPDDLNEGHLDRFFWMMAGLGCLNLAAFMSCAMKYKTRKASEEEEVYTTDGSLDIDGNPALKHRTGGWRACRSILGTEFCQCLAYFGMTINLVTYLTTELHQSNVAAAKNVSTWQATCFLTPLAGAIVADSYWGKYHTMVVGCCIGVAGLLMASLSALLPLLIKNISTLAMASAQEFVLFLGLYMIAFGVGGLRPCLMSFGADQFDAGDPSERNSKGSYFNWYLFAMNCASVISTTAMVWLQDHYGWALGLAIPAMVLAVGLSFLVAATPAYRFQRNRGSPFTRVCQVVVAAVRKFNVAPPVDVALLYEVPEDDCSMERGMAMDARVGSLRVPPASLATFELLTSMALIPLYDRAFVPAARRLTGREKGIPDLLRIGAGLTMAVLAMAAAALVETKRARAARMGMEKTSIVWQVPQYAVMGVGEMLASAGQLDFFYSQAPPAMKTVCMALGFLAVAAGVYLSSLVLTAVSWATATGGRPGWIPDDLNEGHLDRFFWMMAGLGCLNLVAFTSCAMRVGTG
uniref:Uncharacterized protein n=1 Tax=Oryza rufipogon TaxID=4529 RepID=A0A0E0Q2D8_ORYRU